MKKPVLEGRSRRQKSERAVELARFSAHDLGEKPRGCGESALPQLPCSLRRPSQAAGSSFLTRGLAAMWFELDVSCLSRTNYLGYMLTKREQSACLESLGGIKSCAVTAGLLLCPLQHHHLLSAAPKESWSLACKPSHTPRLNITAGLAGHWEITGISG